MNLRKLINTRGPVFTGNISADVRNIKNLITEEFALRERRRTDQTVYLGNNMALARTAFGHKIFIDTRDISLTPHLAMDGEWEMWITHAMARLLKPGMTCVDLGTNFGWYSLLMASNIGSNGKLIGADANPKMVELCQKTMSVNGFFDRSSIVHAALTDKIGDVTFSALNSYMGSGSLKDMGDTATQYHDSMTTITVPAMKLDDLTEGRPVHFMKIDCEGAEPGIIRSGEKTLSSPNLQIFMEYAPKFYMQGEAEEMITTLENFGFEFYSIETSSQFEKISRDALLNHSGWSELYIKRR